MLTIADIEHFISNTIDIVPESDDSVTLGVFFIPDSPATLSAIMDYVTRYHDLLLEKLPLTLLQRVQLQTQRCFTRDEYSTLFNKAITNYNRYPIFKTLLITNAEQHHLFIRNKRDDYEAYVAFLGSWSEIYNKALYSLLYEIHN